jgi:hypothetical protein
LWFTGDRISGFLLGKKKCLNIMHFDSMLMANAYYFNIQLNEHNEYCANWNFPENTGVGYIGPDLDSLYLDIIQKGREGKAKSFVLTSYVQDYEYGLGYRKIPKEDLELLVRLFNMNFRIEKPVRFKIFC